MKLTKKEKKAIVKKYGKLLGNCIIEGIRRGAITINSCI